jgi:ATP-dependent DNA helicase 2 subunit 2
MFEYEMPDVYNNYIRGLKDKLIKSQLGDRRDFWFDWKTSKLGLIDNQALEVSEVTEEEARQFFVLETTQLPRR